MRVGNETGAFWSIGFQTMCIDVCVSATLEIVSRCHFFLRAIGQRNCSTRERFHIC